MDKDRIQDLIQLVETGQISPEQFNSAFDADELFEQYLSVNDYFQTINGGIHLLEE